MLRKLPAQSVQCCITSPPWYGLRHYGHADQIGREDTPEQYLAALVGVFREVRRVLRDDGVVWLDMGDTFVGKQLLGIPWRTALALQADGWILRSEIIHAKSSCMPESVEDRPTRSHETVFLLAKSAAYFYDGDAVREPAKNWGTRDRSAGKSTSARASGSGQRAHHGLINGNAAATGRNLRTVWTLPVANFAGAHHAVMSPQLAATCVMAGTSEYGCCAVCRAPWRRVVTKETIYHHTTTAAGKSVGGPYRSQTGSGRGTHDVRHGALSQRRTRGWAPSCDHHAERVPCTVLDPFVGSGTVALVAAQLGRGAVGIELNPEFVRIAHRRIAAATPLKWPRLALEPSAASRVRKAARNTDGAVLVPGRPNRANLVRSRNRRAGAAGIGRETQRKLDRLASDFPELFQAVIAGNISAHKAAVQAGIVRASGAGTAGAS